MIKESDIQAAEFEAEWFWWVFLLLSSIKRLSCSMDEDR